MLVKGIIESVADDGYSAKVRVPTIHRVATDPLGIPTEELDDATILSIPGVMPVYKVNDVVFVQFEGDELGKPVIVGLLERDSTTESSAKLSGETSIDLATNDWVSEELQKRDVRINEKMITSSLNSYPTLATDRSGHWNVSIPNVDSIYEGLTIKVTISNDPFLIEGYNTLNVNGLGPEVVFYSKTSTYGNYESIRGQELFLTYHKSGLGPYTVINELGALPVGTVVTYGWVLSGGSGSFAQSEEYNSINTRITGLENKIDVKLGSYVGTEIPTLYNYPCNTWTGRDFITNVGVMYIQRTNGNAYRFVAEITAQNLSEYPYGRTEGWIGADSGVIFTTTNGAVNYTGTPTSTGTTVPHVSLHTQANRLNLTAGTYTMVVSTDTDADDVGMGVFLYDSDGNPYVGGGSGLLSNGYQALTTMTYDNVTWEVAIASGYQKTITFTIDQDACAEYVLLTTNEHYVEGNAKLFLMHSTSGFEWIALDQSEIQEILERLDVDEIAISEQGQDISVIQGQISSKIWNTDIAKIKVGGTNLLADTNVLGYTKQIASHDRYLSNTAVTQITGAFRLITDPPVPGIMYGYRLVANSVAASSNRALVFRDSNVTLQDGTTYTMSVYARLVSGDYANIRFGWSNRQGSTFYVINTNVTDTERWTQFSFTFPYTESETLTYPYAQIAPVGLYAKTECAVDFCGMKLEVGTKATDWCDSPSYTYNMSTKYSILEQTVEHIEAEVGEVEVALTTKADNSVVEELDSRVTDVEITAEGLQSTVSHIQSEIVNVPWENLTPYPYTDTAPTTVSGIMWTVNEEDGSVSASGTATADSIFTLRGDVSPNSVEPGTYVLHGCPEGGTLNTYMLRGTALGTGVESETFNDTGSGIQYTFEGARNRFMLQCVVKSGTTVTDLTFYPMFESGTVQHEYRNPMIGNAALSTRVTEAESQFTQTAEQLDSRVTSVETEMATVNWNNLLIYPYVTESGVTINGITYTINDDSSVTATGTATADSTFRFMSYTDVGELPSLYLASGTYTISGAKNSCYFLIDYLDQDGQVTTLIVTTSSTVFNYDKEYLEPKYGLGMKLVVPSGTTLNNVTFYPMLEKGTIVHSYVDPKLCGYSVDYRVKSAESHITQEADRLDLRVDTVEEEVAQTVWDNYVDYPYDDTAPVTRYGITWTKNDLDNSITANGTPTGKSEFVLTDVTVTDPYGQSYLDSGTYTMHGCPAGGGTTTYKMYIGLYVDPSASPSYTYEDTGSGITFYTDRAYYINLALSVNTDAGTVTNLTFYPMLERGDRQHEYVNPEISNHGLSKRVTKTESELVIQEGEIQSRVKQSDYTGNYIVGSLINQTATTIDIEASHINLTGAVTISALADETKGAIVNSSTSKYQFYLSTSSTSATGGSWSDDSPAWVSGKYIWTRLVTTVTYKDGTTKPITGTAVYDKALTESHTRGVTAQSTADTAETHAQEGKAAAATAQTAAENAQSTADTAQTSANNAQTTANKGYVSVVPIYYRSTTTTTPSKPTAEITATGTDVDNTWTLGIVKPKNARYYFTCNQCKNAAGTFSWTAVRSQTETNVTASWCNSTDSTCIDGSHIYTGTVTADKINVNNLQAISASIAGWTLTSTLIYKDITIESENYRVYLQAPSSPVASSVAFAVKNTDTGGFPFRVNYNGALTATNATITGTVTTSALTATGGTIGGWNIDSNMLSTSRTVDNTTYKLVLRKYYTDSITYGAIYLGVTPSGGSESYPFRLNYDGSLVATKATITGNITATSGSFTGTITATGGNIGGFTVSTAAFSKVTSDSLYQFTLQAPSSITPSSTYLMYLRARTSTSASWTYPFYITYDGALVATKATITGKISTSNITATGGTVGGWTLSATELSSTSSGKGTGFQIPSSGTYAIAVGYDTSQSGWGTAPFRVTHGGALTASNATITGTVTTGALTATGGTIGGWTISTTSIYSGSGTSSSPQSGMQKYSSTNMAFYAGWTGSDAAFKVMHSGALVATNATITGAITATSGSFTGKVTATSGSFTGTITSTNGSIGGWAIGSTNISKTSSDNLYSAGLYAPSTVTPSSHSAFYVATRSSTSESWSYPFYVRYDGYLKASNANITGAITATSGSFTGKVTATSGSFTGTISTTNITATGGTIGGYTLSSTQIYRYSKNSLYRAVINAPDDTVSTDKAFLTATRASTSSSWSYPFYVTFGGSVHSTDMNITGGSINVTSDTMSAVFSGSHISVRNSTSTYGSAMWPDRLVCYCNTNTKNQYTSDYTADGLLLFQGNGIGTATSPRQVRHQTYLVYDSTTGGNAWYARSFWSDAANTARIIIDAQSQSGWAKNGWTSGSDIRYKNILGYLSEEESYTLLKHVTPINFTWKDSPNKGITSGFSAQEIRDVLKDYKIGYRQYLTINIGEEMGIGEETTDLNAPEDEVRYSLDYSKLVPVLWKGWQMHEARIAELEEQIKELYNKLK